MKPDNDIWKFICSDDHCGCDLGFSKDTLTDILQIKKHLRAALHDLGCPGIDPFAGLGQFDIAPGLAHKLRSETFFEAAQVRRNSRLGNV